ncbi:MAG: hypothetical protein V1855_02115 [bacterium]
MLYKSQYPETIKKLLLKKGTEKLLDNEVLDEPEIFIYRKELYAYCREIKNFKVIKAFVDAFIDIEKKNQEIIEIEKQLSQMTKQFRELEIHDKNDFPFEEFSKDVSSSDFFEDSPEEFKSKKLDDDFNKNNSMEKQEKNTRENSFKSSNYDSEEKNKADKTNNRTPGDCTIL